MMSGKTSIVMICAAVCVVFAVSVGEIGSHDLLALWNAGGAFAEGRLDQVYAGYDSLFTMQPPESWTPPPGHNAEEIALYPFIYPPLWAFMMSLPQGAISFTGFSIIAAVCNMVLILAASLLAYRIAAPRMNLSRFLLLGAVLFCTSTVFLLPLGENQPQILVTVLMLAAIERNRAGSPAAAGICLALAASIKLYPVLFALIWLAAGDRRSVAWTAIVGAALAALSVLVAGWPLHAAFLHEVSAISKTAFFSFATVSLDAAIANNGLLISMTSFDTTATGGETKWLVAEKPALWRAFSMTMLALVLFGYFATARRGWSRHPLYWPAAIIALNLVLPLAWVYYYLAAAVFLPALLAPRESTTAKIMAIAPILPTSVYVISGAKLSFTAVSLLIPVTVAGFVALAIYLGFRVRAEIDQPSSARTFTPPLGEAVTA